MGFLVVQKADNAQIAEVLYVGDNCYRAEVLVEKEPLQYGRPQGEKDNVGFGETGLDDVALVLYTFIRDDGVIPRLPHLLIFRAHKPVAPFSGYCLLPAATHHDWMVNMFSFFKKKHSPAPTPTHVPEVPTFNYSAPVPQGWGIQTEGGFMDWNKATTIESFDQLRQMIEAHTPADGSFTIVNTTMTYSTPKELFKARFDGTLPWRAHATHRYPGQWEIAINDNEKRLLRFGEPGMGTANWPLVSTENAALILCSFVQSNGTHPELPHLLTTREKPNHDSSGSLYL